jgi:hypothetical protein
VMAVEFGLGWVSEPQTELHEVHLELPVVPYWSVNNKVLQVRSDAFHYDELGVPSGGWFDSDFPLPRPQLHLYNVRHALPGLRTNEVVLVSDVKSAIRIRQEGARVVAVPGWSNWYAPWFELFESSRVVGLFNEEELEHAEPILTKMRRHGMDVDFVQMADRGRAWHYLDAGQSLGQLANDLVKG